MSVEEIAEFIKSKTSKMKKSEGGEEHKKQTGLAKLLPTALVGVFIELTAFLTYKLGLSFCGSIIKYSIPQSDNPIFFLGK